MRSGSSQLRERPHEHVAVLFVGDRLAETVGFGVVLLLRSVTTRGPAIESGQFRPFLLVLAAVLAFTLGIEYLGLLATIVVMVPIAGLASRESRPLEVMIAAVALGLFSSALFIGLLGLQIGRAHV